MDQDSAGITLTPAVRKALKARAHHLDPVVMIGESGLTEAVLAEADQALRSHELIKIRVFGDDRAARQEAMRTLCESLGCAAVQSIGKLLVVYRPRGDDETGSGTGVKRRRKGPYRPKKREEAAIETRAAAKKSPGGSARKSAGTSAKKSAGTSANKSAGTSAKKPAGTSAKKSAGASVKKPSRAPASKSAPASAGKKRSGASATRPRVPSLTKLFGASATQSSGEAGTRSRAAPAKKSLSARTAGKRTDLHSAEAPPQRKGRASSDTQGPRHLQGKAGPRTGGARNRGRSGKS